MAGHSKTSIEHRHQRFVDLASTPDDNGRFPSYTDAYLVAFFTKKPELARRQAWVLMDANPDIRLRIAEQRERVLARMREEALVLPIARQSERIAAKQRRADLLTQVIEERATDPTMATVPGGSTGLVTRKFASVTTADGDKKTTRAVPVYEIDTGVSRELSNLENEVAKELGQIVDKTDVTSGGAPIKALIGISPDDI